MRIIAMSTLCADIFDRTDEIRPGGEALNFAAISCEYDHIQVGIMGTIGDDECGRYILKSIENKPIDKKSIHIIEGKNTASNRIYLTPEGNRYFKSDSWNGGVYHEFTRLSELDIDQVKQTDLVFINYYSPAFQHIIELKQELGFLLAVDFDIVRDYVVLEKYSANIDFLFISGDDEVLKHFHRFSKQYPCIFNVTLAEYGSVTYYNGEEYRVNAVPVKEVIDTTGCGDSYHAGFICSYSKDRDIIAAMKEGSKIASRTLTHVGGFR